MLGLRLHNATRTLRPMPQSSEKISRRSKTTKIRMKTSESTPLVIAMRSAGHTLQQIGQKLNLSRQRIHQIIEKENKRIASENHWANGLSARNKTLVIQLGLESREQVAAGIDACKIYPLMIKNFGVRSYHDLCSWAGTKPVSKHERKCPHCGKEIR